MKKTLSATGFRFSKIVIIESLDQNEIKTGALLKSSLDTFIHQASRNIPVEHVSCLTNHDVLRTLDRLIYEAEVEGQIPIVHFECHGNTECGLFCTDDSVVGWSELGACLTRLNVATGLNLLVVFAACYGGHFLKTLSLSIRAHAGLWSDPLRVLIQVMPWVAFVLFTELQLPIVTLGWLSLL